VMREMAVSVGEKKIKYCLPILAIHSGCGEHTIRRSRSESRSGSCSCAEYGSEAINTTFFA